MQIKLDSEQTAHIAQQELQSLLSYFSEIMEEDQPNIFSADPIYDRILIEKHIEAASLLLNWYGE
jgi:hypothetical protein